MISYFKCINPGRKKFVCLPFVYLLSAFCFTFCLPFVLPSVYLLFYLLSTFCFTFCLPFVLPSVCLLFYLLSAFCFTFCLPFVYLLSAFCFTFCLPFLFYLLFTFFVCLKRSYIFSYYLECSNLCFSSKFSSHCRLNMHLQAPGSVQGPRTAYPHRNPLHSLIL